MKSNRNKGHFETLQLLSYRCKSFHSVTLVLTSHKHGGKQSVWTGKLFFG